MTLSYCATIGFTGMVLQPFFPRTVLLSDSVCKHMFRNISRVFSPRHSSGQGLCLMQGQAGANRSKYVLHFPPTCCDAPLLIAVGALWVVCVSVESQNRCPTVVISSTIERVLLASNTNSAGNCYSASLPVGRIGVMIIVVAPIPDYAAVARFVNTPFLQ
jgi:hypothetical protein